MMKYEKLPILPSSPTIVDFDPIRDLDKTGRALIKKYMPGFLPDEPLPQPQEFDWDEYKRSPPSISDKDSWEWTELSVPDDCDPCCFGKDRTGLFIESPIRGDWNGRGEVWRIGCACGACLDVGKEDTRTGFLPPKEAIAEWNRMQKMKRDTKGNIIKWNV